MTRKYLLVAVLAVACVALAVVLATNKPASAAGENQNPEGRYNVVCSGDTFVLFDRSDSAKSWILIGTGEKRAWLPIKKLDSENDIQTWRVKNSKDSKE